MIKPVNGHLLIEPVVNESVMSTENETYQEIGIVVLADEFVEQFVRKGDKVYFDSWLAAKFPKNKEEDYWLVEWKHVRAVEHG